VVTGSVVGQFDCNRLSSYFFGGGRFPLVLSTATDTRSVVMMYFVVIVTVPSLLLISVRSAPLIEPLVVFAASNAAQAPEYARGFA
jgi:hypothetical protein